MTDALLERALEMRNAIDQIELALNGWPEVMDLPEMWGEPRHHRELGLRDIKGNCGQVYQIYDAFQELNRIINSDDFTKEALTALTAGKCEE